MTFDIAVLCYVFLSMLSDKVLDINVFSCMLLPLVLQFSDVCCGTVLGAVLK